MHSKNAKKPPKRESHSLLTNFLRDPDTPISEPPQRIGSHQRHLTLFQDGFAYGWRYCIDHLPFYSRQIATEHVIRRKALHAGSFPWRAQVLPVIVVWPARTGRDRVMTGPI